ncbi:MAG: MbcA/ParS/Xre antitoxin family protein [Candidatus Polarisedimenticolaceae bacterium]|nr:MbcA/ParS/Xre antitoxin family protein [Candidatus Polarisedimenticolaceae bacterium]
MTQANDVIESLGVHTEAFTDKAAYIRTVREGVPGLVVKSVVKAFNNRDLIVRILNTSSANLSRIYRVKHMNRMVSEEVLDMIRIYRQAIQVFGSKEKAIEWIKFPIPALAGESPEALFDTFEGRRWVAQLLRKIEYGEFA